MAASAAPYGLRLHKMRGNVACSGATNEYRIASAEADVFYNGQPVQLVGGYIVNCSAGNLGTSSTPDEYIGVFVGCSYTDPNTSTKVWKHYYPGGVAASDIVAYIVDDPAAQFMIQANTEDFNALDALNNCYALESVTVGSTVHGNSIIELDVDGSPAAGVTLPFKVVGIAGLPDNVNADGWVDCIVQINGGFHILDRNG